MDDAAEELVAELRYAELAVRIVEEVLLAGIVPDRDMGVAAVAGQVEKGFGMNVARARASRPAT